MGKHSRKQRPAADAPPDANAGMRRGYARSAARNEEVRRTLAPFDEHERPAVLVVSAAIAALIGVGNTALYVAGVEVQHQKPNLVGIILLAVLMFAAAWGMWTKRYWAVLGFEALLGITIAIASLSLIFAGNVAAAGLSVAILLGGGYLFWKLVRVMARLQTPRRVS